MLRGDKLQVVIDIGSTVFSRAIGRGGLLALLLLVGYLGLATGIASAAPASASFCKRDVVVRDYWRPLEGLPQGKGVPQSGRLRFGPSVLRIYPPRGELVVIGHDRLAVQGSLADRGGRSRAVLGWRAISSLDRIDRSGKVIRRVKAKSQSINTVEDFGHQVFGFGSRVDPGLYQLAVRFKDRTDRQLGEYREFFRAVQAQSHLRLGIDKGQLHRSEFGKLRVENLGTVPTNFFYQYRLWTLASNGARTEVPLGPLQVSDDRPVVQAGMAGRCFTFQVPANALNGDYAVGIYVKNPLLPDRRLVLNYFDVVS